MANQVDILFNAQVKSEKAIDDLLKKLKELESMQIIDLKAPSEEIKKISKDIEKIGKEKEDNNKTEELSIKKLINIEKAKQEIIISQNKELKKSEELAKQYLLMAEKGADILGEHWSKLKTLQAEEMQVLNIKKQEQKAIDENIKSEKIQFELEKKRLREIYELKDKLNKSELNKADRIAVSKDLYVLEKRLKNDNFSDTLYQVKKEFEAKVDFQKKYKIELEKESKEAERIRLEEEKRVYNAKVEFAKQLDKQSYEPSAISKATKDYYTQLEKESKEAERIMNQKHSEAIKMNNQKNKEIETQDKNHLSAVLYNKKLDVKNSEDLRKIELNIIKNNLQKQFGAEYDLLKQKKNLRQQDIKNLKDAVDKQMAINQGARANFTQDISNLMAFRQFANYYRGQTTEFEKLEDSLFQTGIVAGRSAIEIRSMRQEVLDLGLDIPRTTQEILDNITAVQRTGRSYEEAGQIINKSAKLAVASGESIALSTDVINKALIAFNINVSETGNVMDIFHTASVKSPLDLKKISDGLKNSASSMRNFIESTNKSGQELEDYKMKLLGMTTALLGGQSALGKMCA